ncbi:MAG: HNH endonuclease [Inconstantimicrobium porci]|uniref:HNH endonuclease n=1 Tax=Inconstantimicrobium porci TaxID=2652291 RepID=UPI002A91238C|nr:HNH endonuclease [Inconstantimicrobium porci]MDY5912444.1 HNH endonuclease [Inconstantimicrobium porci]
MLEHNYICDLCGRKVPTITKHHLIPKEHGGRDLSTAKLCIPCHKQIHALYTNKYLSTRLYTIDLLKDDEKIKKYLNFIRKHPGDTMITIKKSKRR